jgi:hypothetical protein
MASAQTSTAALRRETVQFVFSLRFWTPKTARVWAAQRGYAVRSVQSNDHVCIVHIRAAAEYHVKTLHRTYLEGQEGVSVGTAILR